MRTDTDADALDPIHCGVWGVPPRSGFELSKNRCPSAPRPPPRPGPLQSPSAPGPGPRRSQPPAPASTPPPAALPGLTESVDRDAATATAAAAAE